MANSETKGQIPANMRKYISSSHRTDLVEKGYTVIDNVLTTEEADRYRQVYSDWVAGFKDQWPKSKKSLIQDYKVGHMEPAWAVRLKCKRVFQEVWGTEKLLTSFDAIAIGRPPEDGAEEFHIPGPRRHWLHIDQGPEREGLHAYQGAVYLETAEEDDWAFEVIEGTHKYHEQYYKGLCDDGLGDIKYFTETCRLKRRRVPVAKGGMVLWDSRLVHANAKPMKGRKNPGRWRYVVFVCMTPAKWADKDSLKAKRKAYKEIRMTTHWPSNGIEIFPAELPSYAAKDPNPLTKLPPSANTTEAKKLAGILPYGKSTEDDFVMEPPKWKKEFKKFAENSDFGFNDKFLRRRRWTLSIVVVAVAISLYVWL